MRLVTFSDGGGARIGVHDAAGDEIIDLAAVSRLPRDMTAFVALGKAGLQRARHAVKSGEGRIPCASVKMLAPFPRPAKNILCMDIGFDPPRYLKPGDTVAVTIEPIGTLENPVS